MEGGRIFDSCHDMLALLDNPNNSLWIPPSSFHDTMVNFDEEPQRRRANPKRGLSLYDTAFGPGYEGEDTCGEESDANPNTRSEKKRRLTAEQVEFLEKSFVKENKLDPERKEKLAKQLGLQSKQVAIWFQNRRARYKTKQIEKEFDTLKASYDRLKDDYDSLIMEKEQLQDQVDTLKKKLEQKEIKESNSSPKNTSHSEEGMSITEPYDNVQEIGFKELVTPSNKTAEDASSAKSDVLDYESPNWTDANQACSLIEASSSFVCGPDQKSIGPDQQSDILADDEEHFMMSKNLLLPKTPPTFNDDDDPSGSSCNFSLVEDQPFWSSWLY